MSLIKHVDRIAIISLPHRSDRREQLMANLEARGLATAQDITWVDAVDGTQATLPTWWKCGPGAWGCRASQLAVLEAAQRDGLESVLILEDDAHFHQHAAAWLSTLMPILPADWDFFFLGGQHMRMPRPTADPRLLQGTAICRTHAYAVHRRAFSSVIEQVGDLANYEANPTWHIDHQYARGLMDGRWRAYAPAWWLAAQEEGASNIARQSFQRRWWVLGNHYWQLPFVSPPEAEADGENTDLSEWVYRPDMTDTAMPTDRLSQALWLRDIAREASFQGRLPSCPLPPAEIARLWPGGHRSPGSVSELAHLADYPANQLFPHPFAPPNFSTQQPNS